MIDVERVHGGAYSAEPYRVFADGEVLRNKKGQPKRFGSMLKALTYAQHYIERKYADAPEVK